MTAREASRHNRQLDRKNKARNLARQVRLWSPTVRTAAYIVVIALWVARGNGPSLS
jgi:hypothetical protein